MKNQAPPHPATARCCRYPPKPFDGKIGDTYADSTPEKPEMLMAPEAAPNVLVVLIDDVGFGHTSTFGGPVNTPTLQRLADDGLRYNRFHTTALCSPTRAALLTGRNHHSAHTGTIMELATGYPGYDGVIGRDTATVAETLRLRGYNTAAFGKWHNTPPTTSCPLPDRTTGGRPDWGSSTSTASRARGQSVAHADV